MGTAGTWRALVVALAIVAIGALPSAADGHRVDDGWVLVGVGNEAVARALPCPLVLEHYEIWRSMPVVCFDKQADDWRLEQDNLAGRNYRCQPPLGVGLTPLEVWQCPVLRTIDMGDHVRVYGDLPGGLEAPETEELLVRFRLIWLD